MTKKSKKKTKKRTRYNKQKYASFNTKYQVGVRRELLGDIDYVDKLSEEEKDWLNRFLQETVVTNFNHGGENIITDPDEKRKLYSENNKRNKDVYALAKAKGALYYNNAGVSEKEIETLDAIKLKGEKKADTEDFFNLLITLKDKLKK
jgi:hypothetical protein